jgi:hypothetical protein
MRVTYIDYEEEDGVGYSMVIRTSMSGITCWKCMAEVQPNIEHRCASVEAPPKPTARKRKAKP